MVVKKHEIEAALFAEKQQINSGHLKEDNPLDTSDAFRIFCEACRRGDLKVCQEQISAGVNINARDRYDYTPLILASLCGHYEVCQHLLESGALCERDTFQGERCLYNALNDRIRNLLLQYDFSKSTDPLQPLAAHTTSLLSRPEPKTSDILVSTYDRDFALHKFILAARSPYFAEKLARQPDTTSWKLPPKIPSQSFNSVVRYLYLGEASADLSDDEEEQKAILAGIDKLGKQLEVPTLFENIIDAGDRRMARQRRTEEMARGRDQFVTWFQANVLRHKVHTDTEKADQAKWDRDNAIFADVLLRADEPEEEVADEPQSTQESVRNTEGPLNGIPIGNFSPDQASTTTPRKRKSVLFPAHRAMLLRSEFFSAMFSSSFREAQDSPHLHIIPIDCSPQVLEIVLTYLYTEKADFSLEVAVDVLFAADLLFIEKLKQRAAVIISTLGNGGASVVEAENPRGETATEDVIDVYDIIRAGWDTRVHRLEEFGARFIAYRLERFIDDPDFEELVKESASRIQGRQETDTVELIDDIRYYLSDRFRLRMEDSGIEQMTDGTETLDPAALSGKDEVMFADDEGVGVHSGSTPPQDAPDHNTLVIRTLDGEIAGDEFAQDAINYQILLNKIDSLLDKLTLDA
ncbi:hypothetical protein M436DRAFT_63282 [Aureobasidium namibiae CBS 147.97]|uniref:BTB domain-containing protein n=1 Tax=Aureobasidium namibiae CBS 147.97 TaxID=1043004 RepID=A0A074WLD5_9PEZI